MFFRNFSKKIHHLQGCLFLKKLIHCFGCLTDYNSWKHHNHIQYWEQSHTNFCINSLLRISGPQNHHLFHQKTCCKWLFVDILISFHHCSGYCWNFEILWRLLFRRCCVDRMKISCYWRLLKIRRYALGKFLHYCWKVFDQLDWRKVGAISRK